MARDGRDPTNSEEEEMAMVRFSLIAPIIYGTFTQPSKAQYYREASESGVTLPDGRTVRYSPNTIKHWAWIYGNHGFEGLRRPTRSDAGGTHSLTPDQVEALEALREGHPGLSAVGLRRMMVDEGLMAEDDASDSTFQRYVRNNPRRDRGGDGAGGRKDRRAFQAERPGDLWQADTMCGPYVLPEPGAGDRVRAWLQMVIDDRTRLIVAGRFWRSDNGENFQRTLRMGIETWGLPRTLYCDNGGPYKNNQLTGICGRLGIVLRHAPVHDGAAKGKVERNFRTLRSRFLAAMGDDPDLTMDGLNDLLAGYVLRHNGTPHSALGGKTPLEVWEEMVAGSPLRVPRGASWLDECFLNRVDRKVNKDATVRVNSVLYDVPQHMVGEKVSICYEVGGGGGIWVVDGDRRVPITPTDKEANGRIPREVPRYRYDWTGDGGDRA